MPTTAIDREPASTTAPPEPPTAMLVLPPDVRLYVDPDGFETLCAANRDLRLELKADGGLVVMSPASSDNSRRNFLLAGRIMIRNEAARLGVAFDSSGGFTFPDGPVMTPDAS